MVTPPAKYISKEEETRIAQFWQDAGVFVFDKNKQGEVFSIDTPPPTISGRMHIGHAFSYTQQDIMARYYRMQGKNVFYPFGTDDNGLPTEKLVQKERNVSATKMERGAFIDLCKSFVAAERGTFIADWKAIGMSCDFSKPYSTIDDASRKIAQKTFLDLYKKGLAYRKEAPVIWDTVFQTAIAQAELVDVELSSTFNDILFKTANGESLTIATTRPELLAGCVALFYSPNDARYNHLKGSHAFSPLYQAKIPILEDARVDPEKGTGIVMCCTFGDQVDIEWYKQYQLPLKIVINKDGTMNPLAGKYVGMKIKDARIAIIDDLKAAGLLVNQKPITHTVNVGERSGVPVEIFNSKQWYISYLDKKDHFLSLAQKLDWKPAHMRHRLENWIRGLSWDWSISRQRFYGVPIPVWYDASGKVYLASEDQLPVDPLKDRPQGVSADLELVGETDVFDTWFTSASSPYLAMQAYGLKNMVPFSLRAQAHDIINFWLFYTLVKTDLLEGKLPWTTCAISGYVLDPKGEKMSKSKGNTISPQEMMQAYSADAIRFWAGGSKLGEDLAFAQKDLVTANKLVTKLWNATKFMDMFCAQKQPFEVLHTNDAWILSELSITTTLAKEAFDAFDYAKAKSIIEDFFWFKLCDSYIESIKKMMYDASTYPSGSLASAQQTLSQVVCATLKLFSPFIPFATEAMYQYYIAKDLRKSIHVLSWDTVALDQTALVQGRLVHDLLGATRRYKAGKNMPLNTPIEPALLISCSASDFAVFSAFSAIICGTVSALLVSHSPEPLGEVASFSLNSIEVLAPLASKK